LIIICVAEKEKADNSINSIALLCF
jgi:hypothetical protein